MVSITHALARIKGDLSNLLSRSFIEPICHECLHTWRERLLDPVTLIHLFILQILHGNTACSHLPRIAGPIFTASAYCQARKRLPLGVIQQLVFRIGHTLQEHTGSDGRWHGHRVVLIDGSQRGSQRGRSSFHG